MAQHTTFEGAKLALYLGDDLAVILRDDIPGLLFAGYWDLPGGGREGDEGPLDCALRECHEELGLHVPKSSVIWQKSFPEGAQTKWFFVTKLPQVKSADVVLGDEGQRWSLMSTGEYLAHPKAIPAFQDRLRAYLKDQRGNSL
tara:strand:- start:34 stop:462 length:429 start_codon:yes stop_codon:yes gene_type:complete